MSFSLKCIDHNQNQRFFPRNPNLDNSRLAREREEFTVNFARTEQYKKSTIPSCQRLLNTHFQEQGPVGAGEGAGDELRQGAGDGREQGAGAGEGARAGDQILGQKLRGRGV